MKNILIILMFTASVSYGQDFGLTRDSIKAHSTHFTMHDNYYELISYNDTCCTFKILDFKDDNYYGVTYLYQTVESASEALKSIKNEACEIEKKVWIKDNRLIIYSGKEITILDVRYLTRKTSRTD